MIFAFKREEEARAFAVELDSDKLDTATLNSELESRTLFTQLGRRDQVKEKACARLRGVHLPNQGNNLNPSALDWLKFFLDLEF